MTAYSMKIAFDNVIVVKFIALHVSGMTAIGDRKINKSETFPLITKSMKI